MFKCLIAAIALLGLTACSDHPDFKTIIKETYVDVDIHPGTCSGVVVDNNHVLTAGHCVIGDLDSDLLFCTGCKSKKSPYVTVNGKAYATRVAKFDRDRDLALLEVPGVYFEWPAVKAKFQGELGDKLYIIGNPRALAPKTITQGIISKLDLTIEGDEYNYILADATATFGNSGGMVLNSEGQLIGIITQVFIFSGNMYDAGEWAGDYSIFVPLADLKKFLDV